MPDIQTLPNIPLHKQIVIQGMLNAGMSYRQICDDAEVSTRSVTQIKRRNVPETPLLEHIKKVLPTAFYALSALSMSKVTSEKLDSCSAPQLMMVSGIAVDKARDMEGNNRPVFNVVTVVNDCKRTRDKLEAELSFLDGAIQAKNNVTVDAHAI